MKNGNGVLRDPVCGKKINRNKVHAKVKFNNETYYLCCPLCQSEFEKEPGKYIKEINK